MVLKDDTIFVQVRFVDSDGHVYGTIDQSELDGETFVFTPDGKNEIFPNVLAEANRLVKELNDDVKRGGEE